MKNLIIAVIVLMTFSTSSFAVMDWAVQVKATNAGGTAAGATNLYGTEGIYLDTIGTGDVTLGTTTATSAKVAIFRPEGTSPFLYKNDTRNSVGPGVTKTWSPILLWAGLSYSYTDILMRWNTAVDLLLEDYVYEIVMVNDPTGTYAAGTRYKFETAHILSTAPVVPFEWHGADAINLLKMADGDAANLGVKMALVVSPVPEPSSLLALASGLVGLAGFAWRRRA